MKQLKFPPKNKIMFFSNILLYFALEAKHTKFGDPNLITLKSPQNKKIIFSHILLYFALEAKHTKFGDPNLIILIFDFLSLKNKKTSPKSPQNEKKSFFHIFCFILP